MEGVGQCTAKTKKGEPGFTSLALYDVFHNEIVILQVVDGIHIRSDMAFTLSPISFLEAL